MTTTRLYSSLAELQKETGNSSSGMDTWYNACITAASRWVDDYCHTNFGIHEYLDPSYTFTSDQCIKDRLFLPFPIISLTSISSPLGVIDTSLYEFRVGKRRVDMLSRGDWVQKQTSTSGSTSNDVKKGYPYPIKFTGVMGHTNVPQMVVRATTQIAAALSQEKRRQSRSFDGTMVSILDANIPDEAVAMLKRFRKLIY